MEQVPAEEVRRCRLASQTQCYVQLTVDGCHASRSPPVALRHDFTLDVQHVFECVDRQTDRQTDRTDGVLGHQQAVITEVWQNTHNKSLADVQRVIAACGSHECHGQSRCGCGSVACFGTRSWARRSWSCPGAPAAPRQTRSTRRTVGPAPHPASCKACSR
jgi:CC2D2A N-terminal C2 domain